MKVKFSPQSKVLLTFSDTTLRVWDTTTWTELWKTSVERLWGSICFSNNGHLFSVFSKFNEIRVFRTLTGDVTYMSKCPDSSAHDVLLSPDGLFIIIRFENRIEQWNLDTKTLVKTYRYAALSAQFMFDGRLLVEKKVVSVSDDGRLLLFGKKDDSKVYETLNLNSGAISQLHIFDGTIFTSRVTPKCVFLHDRDYIKIEGDAIQTKGGCLCAVSPNLKYFALRDKSRIRIFDVDTRQDVCTLSSNVLANIWINGCNSIEWAGSDRLCTSWNIVKMERSRFSNDRLGLDVDFSSDGTLVAAGDLVNRFTIYESATGRVVHSSTDALNFPRILQVGERFVSWDDGTLKHVSSPPEEWKPNPLRHIIYDKDLDTGDPEAVISTMSYVTSGKTVILAGRRDGSVTVHDPDTLNIITALYTSSVPPRNYMDNKWRKILDALIIECGEEAVARAIKSVTE